MAGVLRHGAPPRAVHGAELLPAAHGAHGLRPWCRCRCAIRCVGRRSNRVSTRRCGDAPAPGARLDAQPGADDHRLVPREGPAHRLDARGAALHGPPDRRRPGQQPARLAVDGRDGDRPGAVLPDLQPGQPEPQVRSRRRLHPPLGAGAGGVAQHRDPRPVDATARRSIGVPRSGRRSRRRAGRLPRSLSPRALSSATYVGTKPCSSR